MTAAGASNGNTCTVGDKTFSGFSYSPDGFNVPATNVGVGPATTINPGVLFNALWQNATAAPLDAVIVFTVTAPAATPITDAELQLDGVVGSVLDVESLSNGVVLSSGDNLLHSSAPFAAVTSLVVHDDVGVNPGGAISSIDKQFSQSTAVTTPEPASLAILGISLLGMGAACRRRRK